MILDIKTSPQRRKNRNAAVVSMEWATAALRSVQRRYTSIDCFICCTACLSSKFYVRSTRCVPVGPISQWLGKCSLGRRRGEWGGCDARGPRRSPCPRGGLVEDPAQHGSEPLTLASIFRAWNIGLIAAFVTCCSNRQWLRPRLVRWIGEKNAVSEFM
jgi:hypothetical protein